MAILPIYEVPHPVLREVATPVVAVDDRIRTLLDDMAETMYAAPGVGLAAPQVGVLERLLVAAVPIRDGLSQEEERDEESSKAFLTELINPVITSRSGTLVWDEGCLSVPDMTIEVTRAETVVIEALNRHGESFTFTASGFYAVVLQHEMDHLDGKTLYQRLSPLKRALYLKKLKKQRKNDPGPEHGSAPPPIY
jgi:peptide deformylase